MLVIGGGIIGWKWARVFHVRRPLDVVEVLDGLMSGVDRDLVKVWQTFNARRFDNVMLKTKTTKVEAVKEGLRCLRR